MMVDVGMDHVGTDVRTELADNENAKGVPDNAERDNDEREDRATSVGFEKEITGNQTGEHQHEARMNAATFLGHLQRDARELEEEAFVQNIRVGEIEHDAGRPCG